MPREDAFVVARLKAAGALILGKTATTELAFFAPAPTRNPANPGHTPGGSSSGSAAAVAAGQAPLAVGTQTAGSVIRPAAFCGVVGFKPSFGAVPRTGILAQSPSLDTVGVFARSVPDAALLAETLDGHDPRDRATAPAPPPRLLEIATAPPPLAPVFAFVRPPGWDDADPDTRAALEELAAISASSASRRRCPPPSPTRRRSASASTSPSWRSATTATRAAGAMRLSEPLRAALDAGKAIPARDYIAALDWPDVLYAGLEAILEPLRRHPCAGRAGPGARGARERPGARSSTASGRSAAFRRSRCRCSRPSNGLPMGAQLDRSPRRRRAAAAAPRAG